MITIVLLTMDQISCGVAPQAIVGLPCVQLQRVVVGTTRVVSVAVSELMNREEKETCKGKCRKFIYSGSDEGGSLLFLLG